MIPPVRPTARRRSVRRRKFHRGPGYAERPAIDVRSQSVRQRGASAALTMQNPHPRHGARCLAGRLKAFSNLGYTTNSNFVQAIEYAVDQDDVDVINESFGSNPFPDTDRDPISLADAAAVAAGVTVVVATGDGGPNGTLGAPSTDPYVIAAGASHAVPPLRARSAYGAQALANGDVSNNISALSSGGFAQRAARTVDVVAPGDLGWALCSTTTTLYTDCTNFNTPPGPTPLQAFGGTSESTALTSGLAALVIQAYRSTHNGASPSPALVKQIMMSTATDLGAPSSEQGAGLINSLEAVKAALSIVDENGRPATRGGGLLLNPTSARITAEPNAYETRSFSITNTGSTWEYLRPSLDTLGAAMAGETLTLNLDPATDPTFLNVAGTPRSYISQKITVPSGAQHLDVAIAYPVPNPFTSPNIPIVFLGLLDPSGRQAAYSIPQGEDNGYAHVDIVKPNAGTWTVLIWTHPRGVGAPDPESYSGPLQLTWAAERYVKLGSVSPSHLDLAPGATQSITAQFSMPSQPGDLAAAIRFVGDDAEPEIPVSLRALIPVGPLGGSFTGTLTGGNGTSGCRTHDELRIQRAEGYAKHESGTRAPGQWVFLGGLSDRSPGDGAERTAEPRPLRESDVRAAAVSRESATGALEVRTPSELLRLG